MREISYLYDDNFGFMKNYRAIIIDDEKNVREALGIMLRDHCPQIKLWACVLCGRGKATA